VRKDGTRVHAVLGGALMDASRGRVVAFALDQTEHHRVERERQEALAREHAALAEAEEANRAKIDSLRWCPTNCATLCRP